MKANLAQREPQRLQAWQKQDLYTQIKAAGKGKPQFVLADGPPYANGDIHIGHAVNKVLKDIIVKSKRMAGFDAPYIPGWDCHGLPIELEVEKKVGKVGQKVDARGFRQACRDYAGKQVDRQRKDFVRLGVLGDWQDPYLTMNFQFEADQVRALAKMVDNGHLHRGFKPVHWCPACGSSLAEAEVEYEDKTSPAIDVRFKLVELDVIDEAFEVVVDKLVSVVIWTTTPWTLPANQAVAVGAELEYALVDLGDECVIVATELVDAVVQRCGIDNAQILSVCVGEELVGLPLQHPFNDRQVPVVLGSHVTLDAGTGCVHIAPAHGQEDFQVGLENDLPVLNPVNSNGVFLPDTEFFAGQHVFKANEPVLEVLQEKGSLLHAAKLHHSYPHCWRHKTPLIFRATPQWFISMEQGGLRKAAMDAIPGVQWLPDWGQARIEGMVEGRPDWCISRQRSWGVPIALFVDKATGEPHPNSVALMAQVAERIEQEGIDAWFELDAAELLGAEAEQYDKVPDILDVWFDSGVVHHCVLERREELSFPADLYLEGSDQHRGWFQSSLLTSIAMNGVEPYKQVLTHGFTVDKNGKKMSKSLKNVVPPQEVINKLGADVLRLWVASTDYSGEMRVSDEILQRTADSYRRIRNTARFLLANLNGFDPATDQVPAEQLISVDAWAVKRAAGLHAELQAAYDVYDFHSICQKLQNFCVVDLGGFYLDVIKDRQYTTGADSRPRRSAQTAMYHIAEALACWLAPVLSFTAEEIWENLPGERGDSVFLAQWHELPDVQNAARWDDEQWQTLFEVRTATAKQLEGLRGEGVIGSSLDAAVTLYADEPLQALLASLEDELRFALITSAANVQALAGDEGEAVEGPLSGRLRVAASKQEAEKCTRCWHRRPDVGSHTEHPEICGRCVENIAGSGEERHYV